MNGSKEARGRLKQGDGSLAPFRKQENRPLASQYGIIGRVKVVIYNGGAFCG